MDFGALRCLQILVVKGGLPCVLWGCAKGAAKASCGETVVQKVFLESPFPLCPLKVSCVLRANLKGGRKETDSPKTPVWTTVSPQGTFAAALALSDS